MQLNHVPQIKVGILVWDLQRPHAVSFNGCNDCGLFSVSL